MSSNKIHVYFMPGMAASPSIFEHISLPDEMFETHHLSWLIPEKNESLVAYAQRMCKKVKHEEVVLVGVSFGGVLVQEMSRLIDVRKLIIVSSIKGRDEMPRRMKASSYLKLYKVAPTGFFSNIENLAKYAFGEFAKNKIELYKKYLSVNDKGYLDWALEQMVNWNPESNLLDITHIHGDNDSIFPVHHIKDPVIVLEKGSHIMILTHYRWFNKNLPKIIMDTL